MNETNKRRIKKKKATTTKAKKIYIDKRNDSEEKWNRMKNESNLCVCVCGGENDEEKKSFTHFKARQVSVEEFKL